MSLPLPPIGDVRQRILNTLPAWFGDNYPNLLALLQAYVSIATTMYDNNQYLSLQVRVQTATGDNLDLISKDYFANALPREFGETDNNYRIRILAFMKLLRLTRPAMQQGLFDLTGYQPIIFEPFNYANAGGYNVPVTGYNTQGGYGGNVPGQVWIWVFASLGNGMSTFGGYNSATMGYNATNPPSNGAYGNQSLTVEPITDAQILQFINYIKPEGIKVNVSITRV